MAIDNVMIQHSTMEMITGIGKTGVLAMTRSIAYRQIPCDRFAKSDSDPPSMAIINSLNGAHLGQRGRERSLLHFFPVLGRVLLH